LLPKETHFTKTKKTQIQTHTHTQTTSPETKPRQQPQPTSPLALPADFHKIRAYLLACNISESWRQLSLYHLTIQREIETKANPERGKKEEKKSEHKS
jgi:hypothetical protein